MKYYLIPVVDNDILCDGESLRDIFSREFPELSKREDERVDIIYSTRYFMPIPEVKLRAHNQETREMYDIQNVPTYLIATGDDEFCAREIVSGKWLHAKYPAALGIRETTKESAESYYNSSDYPKKVSNYLGHLFGENIVNAKLNDDPFAEVYEGTAYLDGEIDGKPFSGTFTGTLRLSKKNRTNK